MCECDLRDISRRERLGVGGGDVRWLRAGERASVRRSAGGRDNCARAGGQLGVRERSAGTVRHDRRTARVGYSLGLWHVCETLPGEEAPLRARVRALAGFGYLR